MIDNINILNKNIVYCEYDDVFNGIKYAPCVYIDGEKHKFKDIHVKCPKCGLIYKISNSRNKKIKLYSDLECKNCKFTNKRYPRIEYITKFGDKIMYQSALELSFIHKCEEYNIRIKNGPSVTYFWEGQTHKYIIDFELPEYRHLIEIKGNHIWHRETLKTGKWQMKEKSGRDYANESGKKYFLLFKDNIESYFNTSVKQIVKNLVENARELG